MLTCLIESFWRWLVNLISSDLVARNNCRRIPSTLQLLRQFCLAVLGLVRVCKAGRFHLNHPFYIGCLVVLAPRKTPKIYLLRCFKLSKRRRLRRHHFMLICLWWIFTHIFSPRWYKRVFIVFACTCVRCHIPTHSCSSLLRRRHHRFFQIWRLFGWKRNYLVWGVVIQTSLT